MTQLTSRQELIAAQTLAGAEPATPFASDLAAFGFSAGSLLDSSGHVLASAPLAPQSIGKPYAASDTYLGAALAGDTAVSGVLTPAGGTPTIAFAVPFDTPSGRRVFSGSYVVGETPLSAVLKDTTTLKSGTLYLTDSDNTLVALNDSQVVNSDTLARRNPALEAAAIGTTRGSYRADSIGYTFVKMSVPGTSWSLLMTAPTTEVFVAVGGSGHWLPWLILGMAAILIGFAAWLTIRLLAGRRRLADLNARLVTIARTDPLTGLSNRLHLTELLDLLLPDALRRNYPVCVLMIDVDHFKRLNDTYGHRAGDQALRHVARQLVTSLRDADLLARWGGEEFLAVLPDTDLQQGMVVAQRMCQVVADVPILMGDNETPVAIQTSVGVAEFIGDTLDALVDRADLGLYQAKAAGRNTVRASA